MTPSDLAAPHYHGFTLDQRRTFGALMRAAALHRRARRMMMQLCWDMLPAQGAEIECNTLVTNARRGLPVYEHLRADAWEYARRIRARRQR